ncbi:dual specificity protein phosphatase 22 isoform X2 [Orcinus orca]|nr:dual specificity protein phosphatase 22 isoform X2 [Orcinus orca]XP_033263913.1 dual specificity protein phosphatase 22 isoform X2 [Orcinus orca]XP_033263914.1 dual specificity protein phosphatase 22 isoform X2 [Orcinus orca]XP_033263915.1 dual specificity protein phosphatase 22 isoform X2 [Orcinus orca]XP_033263916.1 dual specificity protein phosphatase 22 isoform X2 [Orcinus orca]
MTVTDFGWEDALRTVRAGRSCANPNLGFQRQLQEFEEHQVCQFRQWLKEEYGESPLRDAEEARGILGATFRKMRTDAWFLVSGAPGWRKLELFPSPTPVAHLPAAAPERCESGVGGVAPLLAARTARGPARAERTRRPGSGPRLPRKVVFGCNCDCEPETQKPGRGSSEAALQSVPNKATLPWGPVVSLRRVGLENWDEFEKQREVPEAQTAPKEPLRSKPACEQPGGQWRLRHQLQELDPNPQNKHLSCPETIFELSQWSSAFPCQELQTKPDFKQSRKRHQRENRSNLNQRRLRKELYSKKEENASLAQTEGCRNVQVKRWYHSV